MKLPSLPSLQIGDLVARVPIVQGGMGVRVSLAPLAAAVANEGGIGTLSGIGLGDIQASEKRFRETSRLALIEEIHKARHLTSGLLAVNIMGALSNAADLVKAAIENGVRIIVYGAGLPMKLPELVQDPDVKLIPIISSSRVAQLIQKTWKNKFGRLADAFIIEGPLAGGHLGYSPEQLEHPEDCALERTLPTVLKVLEPYEDEAGRRIPVIVAGGIYDGADMHRMLELGASAVQMGTRFVCTTECSASAEFKQAYLDATADDVTIVKSPVGMPGRALKNRFLQAIESGERPRIRCSYRCLTTCKIKESKYCIAQALFNSVSGDVDHGLIFCGTNVSRVDRIQSVKELFQEMVAGFHEALQLQR
jgi:nitronate monooxygenase